MRSFTYYRQNSCKAILVATLLLAPIFSARPLEATHGHQLIGIGPAQKGFAGGGIASPQDATWTIFNPAAIIDLERRIDLTMEVFAPERSMTPRGPGLPPLGGASLANNSAGTQSDDSIFFIPTLGAIYPLKKGAIGFGVFGVNGIGVDYDESRTTIAGFQGENFDRRSEYAVTKFALAYAYPLSDTLSLGAGLHGLYQRFRTDSLTPNFTQTQGAFSWDHAFGAGAQVGLYYNRERWKAGLVYTTRMWTQRLDEYRDLLKESADIPPMAQAGIGFEILPNLELLLDYRFIHWENIGLIGDDLDSNGFGWDNQHIYKIALQWEITPEFTARAGYSHGSGPVKEDTAFANSLFPSITEDHAAVGIAYQRGKHALSATYMHAFENSVVDNGRGGAISRAGEGSEISLTINSLILGYTFFF